MKRVDAALVAAVVLFVIYAFTLAPDVTFWDAGEFIAAAHSLGMPHAPGTPLFILVANVWGTLLPLPFAMATNLLSAAATALAAWITARLVWSATGSRPAALASALAAGAMSTAWLNATETEVYAAALALGMLTVLAGERAGREDGPRWTVLTAYCMALAVPLHLSALVTAPVAILLAADGPDGIRWRRAALLAGVFALTIGVGRMSLPLVAAGALLIAFGPWLVRRGAEPTVQSPALLAATIGVVLLGCSAVLFMLVRAQFDPALNQGNPDTLARLATVVSRRQFPVAPVWPRMAAPWIQLANVGQYADWQVALSTGPTVLPSILRSAGTAIFLWLGLLGASWHWGADRRTWRAVAAMLACGTLGVAVYLNLRAGPSIQFPGMDPDTAREARERDYFFLFGFWAWGIWAGLGAVAMVTQLRRPAWAGVLLAALPVALNWRAVTRSHPAERWVPRRWAEALLESTPKDGVLFVAGDNDTYPLWYVQEVFGVRRDVGVVVVPLLATRWYRAEVARRLGLPRASESVFEGRMAMAAIVADDARSQGRRVAASPSLTADERRRLATSWVTGAPVYVEGAARFDTVAAARWASWVQRQLPIADTRPAIDPVVTYFRSLMDCPARTLEAARSGDTTRLDSLCNYR